MNEDLVYSYVAFSGLDAVFLNLLSKQDSYFDSLSVSDLNVKNMELFDTFMYSDIQTKSMIANTIFIQKGFLSNVIGNHLKVNTIHAVQGFIESSLSVESSFCASLIAQNGLFEELIAS